MITLSVVQELFCFFHMSDSGGCVYVYGLDSKCDAAMLLSLPLLCSTVGHLVRPMSHAGGEGQIRKARRHFGF